MARRLARAIAPACDPISVGSVAEARAALDSANSPWLGAVIDIGLPDGSGFDVALAFRERQPAAPILIATGRNDADVINRAHAERMELLHKPFPFDEVRRFVERAREADAVPDQRIEETIARFAAECSLTPREREILAASVRHPTRADLAALLGVSENTAKTQIKSLLRKTGFESLHALSKSLLREALD